MTPGPWVGVDGAAAAECEARTTARARRSHRAGEFSVWISMRGAVARGTCARGTPDAPGVPIMAGAVTTRHLVTHFAVIVREFGALCLLRCVWRTLTQGRVVTFL